jgi:hypothetical protein
VASSLIYSHEILGIWCPIPQTANGKSIVRAPGNPSSVPPPIFWGLTTLWAQYVSECIFHGTQLMAMHNTVMRSNTNCVPPSETYMQISCTQCRTTVGQCKYWGNGALENMTLYMTLYTLCLKYQVQTETTVTPQNTQHYKVILYTLSTLTQQVPNLRRFQYAICRYRQFSFGDACFYPNSFSTSTSTILSILYAVYII